MLTQLSAASDLNQQKNEAERTVAKGIVVTSLFLIVALALAVAVIAFEPLRHHGPLIFAILTCGGLGGLLSGVKKSDGSLQFPTVERSQLRLGFIGDAVQGAAGAIIIFLLIPYEYASAPDTMKVVKLLALALLGGYAGPYLVELALSRTLASLDRKVDATNQKVHEAHAKLDLLLEKDAEALKLSQKHLSVPAEAAEEIQKLKLALQECTQKTKLMVFNQASTMRREHWSSSDPYTKRKIERTIPIFESLCESADKDWKHACYAELGYVQKDKEAPAWKESQALLTKAINLRAEVGSPLHGRYELNRAICAIMLDYSESEIIRDLEVAGRHARDREIIQMLCEGKNEKLAQWLRRAGFNNKAGFTEIAGGKDSSHIDSMSAQ
jgi:uncharacterized protein DUF4257